jgi:type VI secretion system protein ImpI
MALRFNIENETNLPDGGPVSFTVTGKRIVDIGRDRHLDWTLPDPARLVSGKHCEVHYRDGGYWLHDVSTNGTFLNGADQRMRGPHRLRNGDRFIVGHYIIGVALDSVEGQAAGADVDSAAARPNRADYAELWKGEGDAPPPVDRHQLKVPREAARPVNPEFLDWAASVPHPDARPARRVPLRAPGDDQDQADMGWANGARPAPPVPEPPPVSPSPRRPVWTDDEQAWTDNRPAGSQRIAPGPAIADQPSPRHREAEPAARMMEAPHRAVDNRMASAVRESAPAPFSASPSVKNADAREFSGRLARSLGLPENFFADRDAAELGEQVGTLLQITIYSLMELLQARNQAKQMARSTNQTTVQLSENNPLKLSPTPEEAIRLLFGPSTRSYLDAPSAFTRAFGDLKSHQFKTYVAMQQAVGRLVASVDPKSMAREIEGSGSSWLGSSKSKLWDAFLMRWMARLGDDSSTPVEAFMRHFAEVYDRTETAGRK